MPSEYQAIVEEWSPPVFLTTMVLLCAIVYIRGWFVIRKTRLAQFPTGRLAAFLFGLAILWLAIGSPMDGFADALLSAHMVEHLLLMSFVPPLLLLGDPQVPLLRGLPRILDCPPAGPSVSTEGAPHPGPIPHPATGCVARDEPDLPGLACTLRL